MKPIRTTKATSFTMASLAIVVPKRKLPQLIDTKGQAAKPLQQIQGKKGIFFLLFPFYPTFRHKS